MKLAPMSADFAVKLALAAAVVGGVAYVLFKAKNVAGDAVAAVADGLNPFNEDNWINHGVTSLYQGVTGSTGTIGGDVYDATHGGGLDVTSSNNIIYRNISAAGESVSGQKGWNLGGWIYDVTH